MVASRRACVRVVQSTVTCSRCWTPVAPVDVLRRSWSTTSGCSATPARSPPCALFTLVTMATGSSPCHVTSSVRCLCTAAPALRRARTYAAATHLLAYLTNTPGMTHLCRVAGNTVRSHYDIWVPVAVRLVAYCYTRLLYCDEKMNCKSTAGNRTRELKTWNPHFWMHRPLLEKCQPTISFLLLHVTYWCYM